LTLTLALTLLRPPVPSPSWYWSSCGSRGLDICIHLCCLGRYSYSPGVPWPSPGKGETRSHPLALRVGACYSGLRPGASRWLRAPRLGPGWREHPSPGDVRPEDLSWQLPSLSPHPLVRFETQLLPLLGLLAAVQALEKSSFCWTVPWI
jgi:hypothetical protein